MIAMFLLIDFDHLFVHAYTVISTTLLSACRPNSFRVGKLSRGFAFLEDILIYYYI